MSEGKRVKRWAPKVFSGCQTCKRRRIKCDESKPTCQRCARSGLQCEGYAPPTARMFEPGKKSERTPSQERTLVIRQSPSAAPATSPFLTPQETRSFEFFMRKTADLISVYSQREFWTTIIPQATHQHTAVKHSVLAVSILHESLHELDTLTEDHNAQLFHHYNTAIRALTKSQPTTDIVLITCILFWTVENFNGSGQPSFDHMEAAQKILREFKAQKSHTDTSYYAVVHRHIEPIILDIIQHARTLSSREEPFCPEESEETISSVDDILPHRIPATFPTLTAAQDHLRICIKALLYLLNQEPTEVDSEILIERLEVHLQRWIYLFHSLTASGTVFERRLLVVHHVNALILLSEFKKSMDIQLHEAEDFTAHYNCNVTEMEDLLSERSKQAIILPSHDLGLIPVLFTAAVRCVDLEVRTRALTLLQALKREEGSWTDKIAARMAESIVLMGNIGLKLNKMSVNARDWGLSISGKDPNFERFLGGSQEELGLFNMAALNAVVHNYGYQLDLSLGKNPSPGRAG